jgi:hypothetical protein
MILNSEKDLSAPLCQSMSAIVLMERAFVGPAKSRKINQHSLSVDTLYIENLLVGLSSRK